MAWIGYYNYAGTEIINVSRTAAYVGTRSWFRNCENCDNLADHLGDDPYTTPWDDDAPWVDADDPATYGFWGVYPLDVAGVESSTSNAVVTESVLDGGVVGRTRRGTKTVVYNVLLLGQDDCSVEAGFRWLKSALAGGACLTTTGNCGGNDLCYLDCNPCPHPGICVPPLPVTWDRGQFRSLRDVTATVGPVLTAKQRATDGSSIWTVTWTFVAANPFEYGDEVPVIDGFMDPAVFDPFVGGSTVVGGSYDTVGHAETEVECAVPTYQPVEDPDCTNIVMPPAAASITLSCFEPFEDFWRRQYTIPETMVTNWGEVVPKFEIHAVNGAVRQMRLRFYTNDPAVDPCNYCGDLVVSYIPPGATLVIDGSDHTTYVLTAGDVRQRSNHLLYSSNGEPFEWPELTCGVGYTVTVDTLGDGDDPAPVLDMALYSRVP